MHNKQNPMYELWDDICDILRKYDVGFSIGDGLRPGGLADATDRAQLAELQTLGQLTERAWRKGVQVMIEGPGARAVRIKIEYNMKVERRGCAMARRFYVLGPLVTDIFPWLRPHHELHRRDGGGVSRGGDAVLCHAQGAPGAAEKGRCEAGVHRVQDRGPMSADVALGIPGTRDRDDELTKARAALNWRRHFELAFDPDLARAYHDEDMEVDTDFCAMCGHDWCSVRISKEIQDECASGKAEGFGPQAKAMESPGVSADGTEVLEQRGVLSAEQIRKLAHKGQKAACHSDNVADAEKAKMVQVSVLKGRA